MENLDDLVLFARVVEAGGFSAAERHTGIPKSRLSRRVAALEARLGVQLVHRSTHRFQVTALGERVYQHARSILQEAEAVSATVGETLAEPSGLVRVSASPLSAQLHLGDWLAEFLQAHPKVTLSLETSNRFVDLVSERIDLALRFSVAPLASEDVVARPLGRGRMVLVASPALLAAEGAPASPEDLDRLPALAFGRLGALRPWGFRDAAGRRVDYTPPRPRLVSDSIAALRDAAVRGVGLVQLPLEGCVDALQAGTLVSALPAHESPPAVLYAMTASRRSMGSALRALVEHLRVRYAATPAFQS